MASRRFSEPRTTRLWGGRATRAEIDLDVISANTRALRAAAGGAQIISVVKADGYGHGAGPVALAAVGAGAARMAVYTVDEGLALRRESIDAPILLLGPFEPGETRAVVAGQLTPTITSLESAESLQRTAGDTAVPFHLEIDTGLTRAGVRPAEAVPFMRRVRSFPSLLPEGLFTHFASADQLGDEFAREQYSAYEWTRRELQAEGFNFCLHHVSNSAGTLVHPEMSLDAVRCGIATYGYPPVETGAGAGLRPALQLLSAVARVTPVPAGTGVGYGRQFVSQRASTIALVPIGYGDGMRRAQGLGRGHVIIRDRLAPIVGRVSMDQITVDVTDIPDVTAGDGVIVIGGSETHELGADGLAGVEGTISYEILAGIMPRVPRLYVQGGQVIPPVTASVLE
jgi:alanine racemase